MANGSTAKCTQVPGICLLPLSSNVLICEPSSLFMQPIGREWCHLTATFQLSQSGPEKSHCPRCHCLSLAQQWQPQTRLSCSTLIPNSEFSVGPAPWYCLNVYVASLLQIPPRPVIRHSQPAILVEVTRLCKSSPLPAPTLTSFCPYLFIFTFQTCGLLSLTYTSCGLFVG